MRALLFLLPALLLAGCLRGPLECRTEYLYPEYLASEQILTPDPCRLCYYGQQVVIFWNLPPRYSPTDLFLEVRYGTREEETICWPVRSCKGWRTFRIVNDEYWCREGIVSYKAELYQEGHLLADWTHHLWVDIIHLSN